MSDSLIYLTLDQQIEKLKSQKLEFLNENFAREVLQIYGYFNIINGYREPYIFKNDTGLKEYYPGITFEQIFNLFVFDTTIRDGIMASMIDFENYLKATIADIIGSSFSIDHNVYLTRNNYRDKRVSNPRFCRNEILYTLEKTARYSNKEPIKYYRDKYHIIPPWILFKDTYFATIVNLTRFFKSREREILLHRLYGDNIPEEQIEDYKDLMSDSLFMFLDYRNQCAHGGRIYNYHPKTTLRPFLGHTATVGLHQLAQALNCFEYENPFYVFNEATIKAINAYCESYPTAEDIHRLEVATGFTITHNNYIWINPKTHIFHSSPICSGSQNLQRITHDQLDETIFKPCKRCCNKN